MNLSLFLKQLIAFHGAKMDESVLRIIFFILAREFESVETFPGFAGSFLAESEKFEKNVK